MMAYRRDKFGNTELSLNVYIANSNLTDAEIDSYFADIRDALTKDGNLCGVDLQDNLISIEGNIGGDMNRFLDIVREMYTRDCLFESDKCIDEFGNQKQYEVTGEEWEWLCSFAK